MSAGSEPGIVRRAIRWMGTETRLNLFVVGPGTEPFSHRFVFSDATPRAISRFEIDFKDDMSGEPRLVQYVFEFDDAPADLAAFLTTALANAMKAGAVTAWFQFDGAFNDTLGPDEPGEIYGIADASGRVSLALEDEQITSSAWADLIARAGRFLDAAIGEEHRS